MCLLALNLQYSCLFGLHQPAPSPSHTIVSPHHCPPTFASLPPCILPAPTLSPHSTITATWHYHLTPSPFCTIVAYIPITPMSILSPHCCPPSSLLPAIIILHYRTLCCRPAPSLHCSTATLQPQRSPVPLEHNYPPHFATLYHHQYPMGSSPSTLTAP